MFDEWMEKGKRIVEAICMLGLILSGGYLFIDIFMFVISLFTPDRLPQMLGDGTYYNINKPIMVTLSELIHSTPVFIVAVMIFALCFYGSKKLKEEKYW